MPPDKEPRKTVIGVENEYGIHWPSFFRLMGIERQNQYAQDTPAYQATLLFTNYLKYALERPAPFVSDKFEFPWMSPNISVWHVNGSRIYPDLSHPEYATPETGDPRNAALYIKAGEYLFEIVLRGLNQRISGSSREEIVHAIRQKYFENTSGPPEHEGPDPISIFKDSCDTMGHSYGVHENYLCDRNKLLLPYMAGWDNIRINLIPFLATRQIFSGSGGFWNFGEKPHWRYILSQRAMALKKIVNMSMMESKPCVSLRDEPLASHEKYFRIQVCSGDALMSEFATYLSLGTTSIVLSMIEDGWLDEYLIFAWNRGPKYRKQAELFAEDIKTIGCFKDISRLFLSDPHITIPMCIGGEPRNLTVCEIQYEFLKRAEEYFLTFRNPHAWEKEILKNWRFVLNLISQNDPERGRYIEWVVKYDMLKQTGIRRYGVDPDAIERHGLTHPSLWNQKVRRKNGKEETLGSILTAASIQYANIDKKKSVYWKLARAGKIKRLFTETEIKQAIRYPPWTRALLREYARMELRKRGYRANVFQWEYIEGLCAANNSLIAKFTAHEPFGDETLESEILRCDAWLNEFFPIDTSSDALHS